MPKSYDLLIERPRGLDKGATGTDNFIALYQG